MNGAPLTHLALLLLQLLSGHKGNLAATKFGFWCTFDPRCVRTLETRSWELEQRRSMMNSSENVDNYLLCAVWLNHSSDKERGWKRHAHGADVKTSSFSTEQENTKANPTEQLLTCSGFSHVPPSLHRQECPVTQSGDRVRCRNVALAVPLFHPPTYSPLIVSSITYLAFSWLPLWWSTSLCS